MRKKLLNRCPVCGDKLEIALYKCNTCGTEIKGNFENNNFSKLSDEESDFVRLFLFKRGNIKELEKELNISYPTVIKKIDQICEKLGKSFNHKEYNSNTVLELLYNGDLTVQEAELLLKSLNKEEI